MKILAYVILIITVSVGVSAQTDMYHEAWNMDTSTIVINAYGPNEINFAKVITDQKVGGLIHKATEGLDYYDERFQSRKKEAQDHNLLYGAYHVGRNGDPIKQADFFLKSVGDYSDVLLVLNLESDEPDYMNMEDAEKFIYHIHKKTGKYPVVYVNHRVFHLIVDHYDDESLFANCMIWYERLMKDLPLSQVKNAVWQRYFLWQFASKINCEEKNECYYTVPGTRKNIGLSVFPSDRLTLEYVWMANSYSDHILVKHVNLQNQFKGKVYCPDSTEITGIQFVEIRDKNKIDPKTKMPRVIDRYLVYYVGDKLKVSRRFFEFVAKKTNAYNKKTVGKDQDKQAGLAKMGFYYHGGSEFSVDYKDYSSDNSAVEMSEAEKRRKVKLMFEDGHAAQADQTIMYNIKFECE